MSNLTFRKGELAIEYSKNGISHNIRIVEIANHDVCYDDETAEVMMGAFAVKTKKDNLYKLPASDADISNTVLVAHYKSASSGLNLQWANVTVYFSPTYSYQEFEQSIGRTHRNGQTKKCLYYLFSVRNTVDHDVWQCLKDKRDFNEKLWKEQSDENED